jgi:puromycin-sensitive aminopeptidase
MNDFRLTTDVRPSRYTLRFDLDLEEWRSTGTGRIELANERPTREITLHSCDLDNAAARLDGEPASRISYDEDAQTATLEFASEIAPGEHVLELEWRGEIREKLRGLYRSTRSEERYAATQFEAADARRAFPCFDEPEFKARFRIELVHPTGLAAISNAPIESSEDLGGGRTLTRFREMPRISTYLVAFTVGPFEFTPEQRTSTGHPVRVCLPPKLAEQGLFSLDAHARALEWLESYTGITYPYTKVDAIGLPDFEAGAMENPGAITYRTRYLAADRRTASVAMLKAVFSVAAHELTHMWWGDLVTMKWWDDLWLNESFASFVGDKATSALNPQWEYGRDIVREAGPAFSLDSLRTTHAISMEVRNADEASERFDEITYNKGQAVLRMIEGFLGETAFRDGVRIYLRRHREANAAADDFWRALDESSGRDVTGLAHAWIREPGHPIVRCAVRETGDGLQLTLRQERFFADPDLAPTEQVWPVPMVVSYGTAAGEVRQERVLLSEREATVTLAGARWYFPNGGASGFYRYAFDDRSVALLAGAVASLSAEERLDLVGDTWALVRARKASVGQLIELLNALRGESDRAVLQTVSEVLGWIEDHAVTDATRPAFARLVEGLFRPELERLGWEPRQDDTDDEREKRGVVLAMLGMRAAAADVRAEARRRIDAHLGDGPRVTPDLAGVLAAIAARQGNAALYERYVRRMKESELADAQEEARFRFALTEFAEAALVTRMADSIFTELIRDQDRSLMLPRMLGVPHGRREAWRVVKEQWDTRIVPMDPGGKHRIVNGLSQLTPKDLAPAVLAFLEAKRADDIKETAAQAAERLRIGAATAERIAAELPGALERVAQRV